jgi:hypothetical protein
MEALLSLSFVLALVACKKPEDTRSSSSSSSPAPAPSATKTLEPSQNLGGVVGELQREAHNRPAVKVTAEKVFDAIEKAGFAIKDRKQVAGWTMNASYCASATTADSAVIAVCEYADAAKAKAGLAFMNQRFDFGSRGGRHINDSTVMTVVISDADKQKDVITRATSAFSAL